MKLGTTDHNVREAFLAMLGTLVLVGALVVPSGARADMGAYKKCRRETAARGLGLLLGGQLALPEIIDTIDDQVACYDLLTPEELAKVRAKERKSDPCSMPASPACPSSPRFNPKTV
jgi:hypothetical protein